MPASRRPPDIRLPGEEIYCPNGHKIAVGVWAMADDEVVMIAKRCDFRWPPGNAGNCDAIACWLRFKGGTHMAIEVTAAEAHELEKLGLKERLTFLNLRSFRKQQADRLPPRIARPGALSVPRGQ